MSTEQYRLHPGMSPRKKQRLGQAVQYVVLVGLALALVYFAQWDTIRESFLNADMFPYLFPDLLTVALVNTVVYTLSGYTVGFVLGLILAVMQMSSVAVNRWLAMTYVEIFRGLPAIIVFLLLAFGLPTAFPGFAFPFGTYGTVAVGLGLVAAAYLAETFRAGIQAVPKGQVEAARSLGMSQSRATITVVLPQAIRIVIPPLTNELILLCKDSSLVYVMGVTMATSELTKFGSDLATKHANSTPYILAGLAYLLITVPLSVIVRRLEAKQLKAR
ncbi:amino acid ABC transporter permease [Haloglycomyces albus]|uniref:amino acid ABC transporter permease n=1 Tax=Haloglycomyces albus TaxID=526067 RepID=UPI00046D0E8D|nr:amino acid ABC transporter permease [Haloglycomyces albus]